MPSDLHEAANTTKEGGIAWFCPLKLYRHYSGCRIWSGLLYRNYIKLYVSFCAARPGFVAYLFVVQYTTAVLCRCFYIRFVLPLIDTSQIDSDARVFLLTARVGCIGEKASRRIVFVRKWISFVYVERSVRFVCHYPTGVSAVDSDHDFEILVFIDGIRSVGKEAVDAHSPCRRTPGAQYDARQQNQFFHKFRKMPSAPRRL